MISVVIMTHNPKKHIFEQTLDALKNQDLPYEEWELILVDNASKEPVRNLYDISWHPQGLIVEEPKLGCVNARIKTVQVAKGDWYVWVDDDNVLSPNYLSIVKKNIQERPYLGCFGGNHVGKFYEKQPHPKVLKYLEIIAVRRITNDRISNLYIWETTPASAGVAIRADVVKKFVDILHTDKTRYALGRRGDSLVSSEDIDMAYVSLDMGYMNGLIAELSLEHCIPAARLEEDYLTRLKYYNMYSTHVLYYIRFKRVPRKDNLSYYFRQLSALIKGQYFDMKMNRSVQKALIDFLTDLRKNKFELPEEA